MRVQKRSPWLNGLGVVLAAMALWGGHAQAQVSSDKPGSVVIWPKVIADGTRDTIITLTNTSNQQAYAHCNYVNGISICSQSGAYCSLPNAAPGSPGACPGGALDVCQQTCQAADFDVVLTRQQPTVWRVSTGRVDNPFLPADGRCDINNDPNPNVADTQSCPGLFLIGNVPTAGVPFRGSLTCVQVSQDGSLVGTDSLKGEATIETLGTTQISEYNSINFEQLSVPADDVVRFNGREYAACPEAVELSHYASGAPDLVAGEIDPAACPPGGCPVYSEITLVPCSMNFLVGEQTRWATIGSIVNEFESETSWSRSMQCWANFDLRDPGDFPQYSSVVGSEFQRTRFRSGGTGICTSGTNTGSPCNTDAQCGGGTCSPVTGLLALVEEFHESIAAPDGTAASNGYSVDVNGDGSLARPGRCANNLQQTCTADAQCTSGECLNDELLNLSAGSICPGGNCPPQN